MRLKLLKLISFIIALIVPFVCFVLAVESMPNMYSNTYLAELSDKYDRLNSIKEKKIVFVGGSSLPFGLRSDIIEEQLGGEYKVVNFGLYATLGTKLMIDLSKSNINKDDIIILAPEVNPQTYSLYFNPDAVLESLDGLSTEFSYIAAKNRLSLYYNYYKYAFKKIGDRKKAQPIDPIGIYRRDSFNEYGDIKVERENNIMNNGVDANMYVYFNDELLDNEFLKYVNKYVKWVKKRGATMLFSYCPVNIRAVKTSKQSRGLFDAKLKDRVSCDFLYDIEDCLIDERYFYDTNFHLNSAGAVYYTDLIVRSIKSKLNIHTDTNIDIPEPPDLESDIVVAPPETDTKTDFDKYNGEPNNDYVDYFDYKQVGNSYEILAIKDEYKDIEEIILPSVYNNRNITSISQNALYGCVKLKRVHIGKTYKSIEAGAFNGCVSLEGIYLYEMYSNKISPPRPGLFDGCGKNAFIYVPEGSDYLTGYTWYSYASYIKTFSTGGGV